jgi:hypothetical protein
MNHKTDSARIDKEKTQEIGNQMCVIYCSIECLRLYSQRLESEDDQAAKSVKKPVLSM